jgi:RNA polymerase sigma-70 factor (ECF subfamily)
VEIYAPLVYRLARRRGLQDADAADLTQDVLQAVNRAAPRLDYDPERGAFRSWLFTVARNKLQTFLARRRRRERFSGPEVLEGLAAPDPAEEAIWEQEYQQRLFDWAAERVRGDFQPTTWRAFWLTAIENRPPAEAARELGVSVGAVYIAKSRVLARLREQIQQVQGE